MTNDIVFVSKGSKWEEWSIYKFLTHYFELNASINKITLEDLYKLVESERIDPFQYDISGISHFVKKNEALDVLHQLMLITNGTSFMRYAKAIYQLHHEHQYPANMVEDILEIFNIYERSSDILKISERYFELLPTPNWLKNVLKSTQI